MAKQRQRQGTEQNKWLTNTYSDFVPTKIGDTIKEKTLAYLTAADRYGKSKTNFQTKREGLNAINVAPGNKEFFQQGVKEYEDAYKIAEERGDFENMQYDAGDIVGELSSRYRFKDIQSDHKKYAEQEKALQENEEYSEKYKQYIRNKHLADNKEGTVDAEGNLTYNKYVPMEDLTWAETATDTKDYLDGMKADGFYEDVLDAKGNSTGQIKILKDIPGHDSIKKHTVLSKTKLYDVALDFLSTSQKHISAINDEAKVRVGSIFLAKPDVTLEELAPLVNESNPHRPETEKHKKWLKDNLELIVGTLEERKKKAGTENFNEQQELEEIITRVKAQDIKHNYAKGVANRLASVDEDITTFKRDKEEVEEDTTTSEINASGLYTDFPMFEDDTFASTQIAKIEELGETITTLEDEELKQEQQLAVDPNSIPEGKAKELKYNLDNARKEKDYLTNQINTSAEAIHTSLKNEEIDNEGNFLIPDETYQEYTDRQYIRYQEENEDEVQKTKEEFTMALNKGLLDSLNDKNQPLLRDGINKVIHARSKRLKEELFHRVYPEFDFSRAINTKKEITPIKEFINTQEAIKKIAYNYPSELMAMGGGDVAEFISSSGLPIEKIEFNISSAPDYNGNLVGQFYYDKVTGTGGVKETERIIQTFAFPKNNEKTKTIKRKLKQAMQNLVTDFLPHYENLDQDKKDMVDDAMTLVNITDGTYDRFNSLNIRGTKEGDNTKFELGNKDYNFITYNTTSRENHYIIGKKGVTTKGAETELGEVILGWKKEDLQENGKGIGKAYWVKKSEAIKITDDKKVTFVDGFTPQDFGNADGVLQGVTEDNAFSTGTLNKNATSLEQLHPTPNNYRKEVLQNFEGNNIVDNNIIKHQEKYSRKNGYFPLTAITGDSSLISKNVQIPFIKVSTKGANILSELFQSISINTGVNEEEPLKPVISSGQREEAHNKEVGGVNESKHLEGLAIDILFDRAGQALINEIISNPTKYQGVIVNTIPSEAGFYHITLSSDLQNN